ncbi:RNA polymerase sigma factor SigJ [Streptomyces filamentosus]|uniref:RNA polymerase sigma factor SigJ n=2 Tax=Streptomyces TaxID=1883 RepID=A0ABY4UTG6_STRFL|nr:RNA polymerase sigma factor SigJ [Streptomyces filamentosus]EWS95977.1 ECF subfamily RNA polymerase sigma factor [Streptomyces filamentosus NRRL 11379]USC45614.1 RNA polymerase sigma factor SigJ [Streptomyces filamentosus]
MSRGTAGTRADAIAGERRQLLNVAYRLLGSVAEAEDAVQEAYTRWYAQPRGRQDEIASPGAWLTTVTGRICLDVLGSARARRERYVGAWLPDPLPDRTEWGHGPSADLADPADQLVLDESVTMAFLIVMESMTPAERVAFVLHDVFRYPFAEIAAVLGRTPAACKQLAASARRRVRAARAPVSVAGAGRADAVRQVKEAWESKDIAALVDLLDPAAVMTADGGGLAGAALRPIEGGARIAQYMVAVADKAPGLELLERSVNGAPGLVARRAGVVMTVASFDIAGGRVTRIWAVRNPEKLRPWARHDMS